MHRFSLIVSSAAIAVAAPLGAQQLGPSKVPEGHKPPPGMCRIWIDGVPPGRQSAPTDCATAVRNRPSNGRVIWGDDDRKRAAERPARTTDDRDRPRSSDEGERGRAPTSEPRPTQGPDRPRDTRTQDRPRETEERPRREPESPKPRETRETPKREEEQRPRAKPSRKPDSEDSRKGSPARSERTRPDFARKPR